MTEAAALEVAGEAAPLGIAVESGHLGQTAFGDPGRGFELVQIGVGQRLIGEVGV